MWNLFPPGRHSDIAAAERAGRVRRARMPWVLWMFDHVVRLLSLVGLWRRCRPDELVARAAANTGVSVATMDRVLGKAYRPYLDAWDRALWVGEHNHQLTYAFRIVAVGLTQAKLEQRLLLAQHLETVTPPTIPPPIIVLGFPRVGSTLLHNLLALDPDSQALCNWELTTPLPTHDRFRRVRGWIKHRLVTALVPGLASVLDVGFDDPDECVNGMVDCGHFNMYAYRNMSNELVGEVRALFLGENDATYASYAHVLRTLVRGTPTHLVLKDPTHLFHIPELCRAFPGARFVWCHRDPAKVVSSLVVMNTIIAESLAYPDIDLDYYYEEAERGCLEAWQAGETGVEYARAHGHVVAHLAHQDLVTNPVDSVVELYYQLGLVPSTAFTTALRAYNYEKHVSNVRRATRQLDPAWSVYRAAYLDTSDRPLRSC